jgi:2-dehydropantoate 2-reductase
VTVVAREPTASVIAAQGISLESDALGARTARPLAVATLTEPVDVLYVATKALGLEAALDRIQAPVGMVVPLLNGLDHLTLLRERFGEAHVCAATIRIDADRVAPGRIVQRGAGLLVELAYDRPEPADPGVAEIAELLNAAGVRTRVYPSEAQILWSKLVMLNALASTTAASDQAVGFVRENTEWRPRLVACVEEAAAVAIAEGATLDAQTHMGFLDKVHPEQASSMQRDLRAGLEPELDAIQGAVLRAAARHGLECPVVSELAGTIAARAGIAPPLT